MKVKEIRNLSDEQLVHGEIRTEKELAQALFRHRGGQLDDTSILARYRKDIARYQTVQRERELERGLGLGQLHQAHRGGYGKAEPESAGAESSGASRGFLRGLVDKISGKE